MSSVQRWKVDEGGAPSIRSRPGDLEPAAWTPQSNSQVAGAPNIRGSYLERGEDVLYNARAGGAPPTSFAGSLVSFASMAPSRSSGVITSAELSRRGGPHLRVNELRERRELNKLRKLRELRERNKVGAAGPGPAAISAGTGASASGRIMQELRELRESSREQLGPPFDPRSTTAERLLDDRSTLFVGRPLDDRSTIAERLLDDCSTRWTADGRPLDDRLTTV